MPCQLNNNDFKTFSKTSECKIPEEHESVWLFKRRPWTLIRLFRLFIIKFLTIAYYEMILDPWKFYTCLTGLRWKFQHDSYFKMFKYINIKTVENTMRNGSKVFYWRYWVLRYLSNTFNFLYSLDIKSCVKLTA